MIRQPAFPRIWKFVSSDGLRDGALVFTATLLVNASNYAFHFIASHRMTVEDYGAFSAVLSLMTFVSVPATIVMAVIAKSVAELHARKQHERIPALQYAVLRPVLILAGGIFLLSYLANDAITAYMQLPTKQAIPLAGLATALALLLPVMRGTLQGLQYFSALAFSLIIEGGGKLLVGTALMLIGFGFLGGMIGITVGTALALLASLPSTGLFKKSRVPSAEPPVRVDWQRLGTTSLGVSATTLCLGSLGSLDVVLVRHFFMPHEAGIYSATALIGKIFLFAIAFIPMLLLPKATAHAAQQHAAPSPLIRALALGSGVSAIGLLLLAIWPTQAIRFLPGSAYMQAAPLLLPYSIATVFLALATITTTVHIGRHRFHFLLPLALCTIGELVAIQFWHTSLAEVITILLVGHGLAFLGCLSSRFSHTLLAKSQAA